MTWAFLWRGHSTLKARYVYYTQMNKETKLILIGAVSVGEQSQAINKIGGVESYSRCFLYSVLALAVGRSSLCATLMGLRHRGPRHDSARVNHTCKLRTSLTCCTLFSNPFLKLEPLTASIPQEMQAAGHPSVGPQ